MNIYRVLALWFNWQSQMPLGALKHTLCTTDSNHVWVSIRNWNKKVICIEFHVMMIQMNEKYVLRRHGESYIHYIYVPYRVVLYIFVCLRRFVCFELEYVRVREQCTAHMMVIHTATLCCYRYRGRSSRDDGVAHMITMYIAFSHHSPTGWLVMAALIVRAYTVIINNTMQFE